MGGSGSSSTSQGISGIIPILCTLDSLGQGKPPPRVLVLTPMIDKDGNIQNLQLVSGHRMLAPAASDAVKHWRYKPFLLNGQPVEVETTVTVNFRMHM